MLMAVGLSKKAMAALEAITRDFLWGRNPNGKTKKPLIAWEILTRRKQKGGLGWTPMELTAEALLLKNFVKILQNQNNDWVLIAQALIRDTLRNSKNTKEVKSWDASQALFSMQNIKIPHSLILNRMIKAWMKVKKQLSWRPDGGNFPKSATPRTIMAVISTTQTLDKEEIKLLLHLFKATKVKNTEQITSNAGQKTTLRDYCQRNNIQINDQAATALNKLEALLPIEPGLNSGYGDLLEEDTLLIQKLGTGGWIREYAKERTTSQLTGESIITVLDRTLQEHKQNPAPLLMLLAIWRTNWSERNHAQFQQRPKYSGINILIKEKCEEIQAMLAKVTLTPKQIQHWEEALRTV
ncbi:hypothetical protein R1sor_001023 [Riccia sorocarpa]|uniref:Uncharacterized protein n=1 Tax=Riccia sorocarpa TaxID=122646 RepID=A0ABD3GWH1_9MARC